MGFGCTGFLIESGDHPSVMPVDIGLIAEDLLLQIVDAAGIFSHISGSLQRRQQHGGQNSDDGDNDQ